MTAANIKPVISEAPLSGTTPKSVNLTVLEERPGTLPFRVALVAAPDSPRANSVKNDDPAGVETVEYALPT